jgi:hypothetical protein
LNHSTLLCIYEIQIFSNKKIFLSLIIKIFVAIMVG